MYTSLPPLDQTNLEERQVLSSCVDPSRHCKKVPSRRETVEISDLEEGDSDFSSALFDDDKEKNPAKKTASPRSTSRAVGSSRGHSTGSSIQEESPEEPCQALIRKPRAAAVARPTRIADAEQESCLEKNTTDAPLPEGTSEEPVSLSIIPTDYFYAPVMPGSGKSIRKRLRKADLPETEPPAKKPATETPLQKKPAGIIISEPAAKQQGTSGTTRPRLILQRKAAVSLAHTSRSQGTREDTAEAAPEPQAAASAPQENPAPVASAAPASASPAEEATETTQVSSAELPTTSSPPPSATTVPAPGKSSAGALAKAKKSPALVRVPKMAYRPKRK